MALGVKIDFGATYAIDEISPDLRTSEFSTVLKDGKTEKLVVVIDDESHDLLPDVYNLGFGPINRRGEIDDSVQLDHSDYSKVFSTILLTAFNYLAANPNHYLGVDGSSNSRANLYWRFLQNNYNYLDQFFEMFGLKYYVRISRFGKTQYDNPFDFNDVYPHLNTIQKTTGWPKLMYNYFIFKLKPGLTILE